MARRWCEVTVETADGERHSITVEARSVFWAAIAVFSRSRAPQAGERLPSTDDNTVYEVRVLYRVTEKALLAWANREAAKTSQEKRRP